MDCQLLRRFQINNNNNNNNDDKNNALKELFNIFENNACFVIYRQSHASWFFIVSNLIIPLKQISASLHPHKNNLKLTTNIINREVLVFFPPRVDFARIPPVDDFWEKKTTVVKIPFADPHLPKYRFVVVDIVDSDDDPCGGDERVRAAWCIVVCGRYIQDVLQALKLGQGSGAETNQPYRPWDPSKDTL